MQATPGIYLDHAATTAVDERVLDAVLPYLKGDFGNPSSIHRVGQVARRGVEEARERVAATLGVRSRQVVFTSGATEADDQAVFAAAASRPGGIVMNAGEHAAVLEAARRLAAQGRDVALVPLAPGGDSPLGGWEAALAEQAARGGTALVAAMLVNNETGVMLDVPAIAELAHAHGALFLCDAVQGYGVEEFTLSSLGADFLTVSGHKVYGPKGAGALVFREGLEPAPLLAGGAQERGYRPGTHAVPAIVGLGAAAAFAAARLPSERTRLAGLQARFEAAATAVPGVTVNAGAARRSVKHTNLRVQGADGETLLMLLDEAGVYASAGSACAAGSVEPSHVLLAMGLSRNDAKASVRFSYGRGLDEALVDEAAARFQQAVERARSVVAV